MQSPSPLTSPSSVDHAHFIQALSAMMAQIALLQNMVREREESTGEAALALSDAQVSALRNGLASLEQMASDMLYEMRVVSEDTALDALPGMPLSEALSQAVEESAETLRLSSRISFSGEERLLSSEIERLLYRAAREVLAQVAQHTGARRLRFALHYGRDEISMSIEDDGVPVETNVPGIFATERVAISAPPFATPAIEDASRTTGLLLLRSRVEHLGGSLDISSSIEQGTQVQVRLPYLHHTHNEPAAPASAPMSDLAIIRVLVVESQAVTRAGLRRLLESYPDLKVVGEAADGVQAASETAELGPQVVVLDAQLPGGQALEAVRQIKQLNAETNVLLLSTLEREDYLYESLRAGAGGYVLKDIAPDELAQAVRAVAKGEVLVQPTLAGRLISRFGRQGRASSPLETLTARELEVLRLLARGLRNKEIAARLVVSERTVNFHLANIYAKLQVSGRTEALSKAHEQGLLSL